MERYWVIYQCPFFRFGNRLYVAIIRQSSVDINQKSLYRLRPSSSDDEKGLLSQFNRYASYYAETLIMPIIQLPQDGTQMVKADFPEQRDGTNSKEW